MEDILDIDTEVPHVEAFLDEESFLFHGMTENEEDFIGCALMEWGIGLNGGLESYEPDLGEDGCYYDA